MSDFKREERYTVIKHNQLTQSQAGHLKDFLLCEGVPTVKSVVVESDWPEYEPVWSMIERRMSEHSDHVGVIVAKKWLEGAPRAVSLINGSSLPDGAYLYLAPPASSDLAEVTLKILKEAKDIPDGLYARAKHLANTDQSQLAALREELEDYRRRVTNVNSQLAAANFELSETREAYLNQTCRLADAERRNLELVVLLGWSRSVVDTHNTSNWSSNLLRQIDAAINPKPEAASHDE